MLLPSRFARIPTDVPACAAASVVVQVLLMRRAFAPAGLSFVVALTIVVLSWHLVVALACADRCDGRVRALTLLVLPASLAALQGDSPWRALLAIVVAADVVAAGAVLLRRRGAAFACAIAGAALGWAVLLAVSKKEPAPVPVWVLTVIVALALTVGILQPVLLTRRLGTPLASLGVTLLCLLVAAAKTIRPSVPERPASGLARGRPPAVLIVLDSVRADHLKAYGYSRDTMPSLERFAGRHAQRFERSLASGTSSLPSHGSMFTGLRPSRHGGHECDAVLHPQGPGLTPLRDDIPTLAQLLRRAGYWTVGLSGNYGQLAPRLGIGRGFEWFDARFGWQVQAARLNPYRAIPPGRWGESLGRWYPFSDSQFFERPFPVTDRRAAELVDSALTVLRRSGSDPFFLFLNLFDAHQPYRPPVPFRRPAGAGGRLEGSGFESVVPGHEATKVEIQDLVDSYDEELRYLDSELARLLRALEEHPRFAEMLVVIVSDHGEAFGEHGLFLHGHVLNDEILRVPLFIKPGRERFGLEPGGVSAAPFQSVDIFPTVLSHAGLPVPPGLDGMPFGAGRKASTAESFVCLDLASGATTPRVAARRPELLMRRLAMVEVAPWKLIVSSNGPPELHQMRIDPGETQNVAEQEPEVVGTLRRDLPTVGSNVPGSPDPLPPDLVEALHALGYLQ